MTTRPARSTAHISELAIDRMLAGELSAPTSLALRAHAGGCARCGGLLADAHATRAELAAEARPAWLDDLAPGARLTPLRPRPRRAVPVIYAAMGALAAAFAIVVVWPRIRAGGAAGDGDLVAVRTPVETSGSAGTRTKGDAVLGYYVAHGDDVRRGALHDTIVPRDRIELFTTTTAPCTVAVVSVDARGVRSVYAEPRSVAAGAEQLLPTSIVLDGASETVTGIFCAAPFDARAIDLDAPPAGCTLDHFTLTAAPR